VPANLDLIRDAFCQGTYFFREHCRLKMLEYGLSRGNVETAICRDAPAIVEDYPDDPRGAAVLVLGWAAPAWPLHIVVGYGDMPDVAFDAITVYEPDPRQWHNNYRVRNA